MKLGKRILQLAFKFLGSNEAFRNDFWFLLVLGHLRQNFTGALIQGSPDFLASVIAKKSLVPFYESSYHTS